MTGGETGQPDVRAPAPVAEGGVVNYYFPVEVEVAGEAEATLVQRVTAEVIAELDRELASRP